MIQQTEERQLMQGGFIFRPIAVVTELGMSG